MKKKPKWLNKKISLKACHEVKTLLKDLKLHTICESAKCPNISECFSKKVATFLILGNICTRNCTFCAVQKGKPLKIDENEPKRVALAVKKLNLKHVVITSVTRDDLEDGGAEQFVKTIKEIRKIMENITIELLIPDFRGNFQALQKVIEAKPDIIGHNIETVPRLYPLVRPKANFELSLKIIDYINKNRKNDKIYTKSGIMLGLGETKEEIIEVLEKLREVNCEFFSIGQYLAPSNKSYPVQKFISPQEFKNYKKHGIKLGFKHIESGPYVRSSYLADKYLS